MGIDGVDHGGQLSAQFIGMGNRGLKIDEFSRKAALHFPSGCSAGLGCDVTQIHQQAVVRRHAIDFAAQYHEVDQQSLVVVHDSWLRRIDGHISSPSAPVVFDPHAQGKGNGCFDFGGEGIVSIDIFRQKIV